MAGSIVDTRNPEGAEVAFFIATVAIGVAKGFDDALFGKAETARAVMLHTFGELENLFVFGSCGDTSFDTHYLIPPKADLTFFAILPLIIALVLILRLRDFDFFAKI